MKDPVSVETLVPVFWSLLYKAQGDESFVFGGTKQNCLLRLNSACHVYKASSLAIEFVVSPTGLHSIGMM